MKRVCVAFLVVLVMLFSVVISHAENTVEVSASTDSALKNRLFEISIQAKPQSDICAGEITLHYDNCIVEFREVNSDLYYVDATDSEDEVKIVFGSAYCSESQNGELLKVKFKAVSEGSFDVEMFCSDFVTEELNNITVNACDLQITVDKNSVKSKSVKETQKEENTEKITKDAESKRLSSADELYIKHGDENQINILFIICIFLAVVVAFLLGVLFSRKSVVEEDGDGDEFVC